jgi:Family of unknown function (DUF5677)
MRTEDSRVLQFAADYLNGLTSEEKPDPHTILEAALDNPDLVGSERREALADSISGRVRVRAAQAQSVRKKIEMPWGTALTAFDECIAAAEELNIGLVNNSFREVPGETEFGKSKIRRHGHDVMGGPALKMLLLAGLQARACTTATEILELLRAGLHQAAESRTRSLYELNVVSFILSNDNTYEICERYHDAASIGAMRYIREHNNHAESNGWKPIKGKVLKDVQRPAALAVRNWGDEIKTQYGWARPIVPHVPAGRVIRFGDLERVVKGESLRPGYLSMNHSVHAGPSGVIRQAGFHTGHLMATRPSADYDDFEVTATWTLELLLMLTKVAVFTVAWLTERYDDFLDVGELVRRVDETWNLLNGPPSEAS